MHHGEELNVKNINCMTKEVNKAVIMAGGTGSRLWPISVKNKPKQFQAIASDKTMLQETYLRLRKKFAVEDIYISTNLDYISEIKREILEIPDKNIISEPVARGTASSIALTIAVILAHEPDAIIFTFPADHIIKLEDEFISAINEGEKFIKNNSESILTFGIIPTYPETGYGYIKKVSNSEKKDIYKVERFVEKPDIDTAHRYISEGGYYWNAGMYVFNAEVMRKRFLKYIPNISKRLDIIHNSVNTDEYEKNVLKEYPQMYDINFEYAIVENDDNVVIMPLDIGWSDVGSWGSLKDTLVSDNEKHLVRGEHIDFGSKNLLVYGSKKLITTVGLEDLVIVDTDDAILICHKDKSQMIGDISKKIQASRKNKK